MAWRFRRAIIVIEFEQDDAAVRTSRLADDTARAATSEEVKDLIRPSHRDYWRAEPWPEEWLLIEWPEGEDAPTKVSAP
jgi:hypothetical protein